jgi:hypothetical protein
MKLQYYRNWAALLLVIIACTSYTQTATTTIKGKIIHSESRKGIDKAYIYIVSGEEETLSLADGKFALETWQKFPVTLVVEHADYVQKKTVLRGNNGALLISLEKK